METGTAQLLLTHLEKGSSLDEALAFFDSLPAASVESMIGDWRGAELPTGNRLDGMLERMRWHGKRFWTSEDVDPLVMEGDFALNPRFLPLASLIESSILRAPGLQRALRPLVGLLRTRKPAARLRMVEYRGVVSAAMIYDALPIIDQFRTVDESTVLGAMDLRGLSAPYIFVLRREE